VSNGVASVIPPPPQTVTIPSFTGIIEVSTNAATWLPVSTNTISQETISSIFGTQPLNAFYRLRWILPKGGSN
jgi:hypothetical protein